MTFDSEIYRELQEEKMQTVKKLTELNAQHIRSQSRLSGLEIETARCEEAIDRGESSEDINEEVQQLEKERRELLQLRVLIDEKRDDYELKLREIDNRLVNSMK